MFPVLPHQSTLVYIENMNYFANKCSIEAIELLKDYRRQTDHWNWLLKAITFIYVVDCLD